MTVAAIGKGRLGSLTSSRQTPWSHRDCDSRLADYAPGVILTGRMSTVLRCLGRFAAALLGLLFGSCASAPLPSYLVLRLDDPMEVRYAGMHPADPAAPDLLAVDVVTGITPKAFRRRQLAVPPGWETAPATTSADGCLTLAEPLQLVLHEGVDTWRERLFQRRRIERWTAAVRGEQGLALAEDLPPGTVRNYRIVMREDADGARSFELFGRHGSAAERRIANVTTPPELTPPVWSFAAKAAVLPPLFVADALIVGCAIICLPIALPVWWLKSCPEPVDDSPGMADRR